MRNALLAVALAVVGVQGTAWAQTTDTTTYRLTGTRIAFGQDVRVERDEEVSDAAIVIGGSLTIDGRVRDGVVVVGGDLHLSATSDVRGEIVIVGGQITRDPGARQVGQHQLHFVWRVVATRFGWLPSIRFGEVGRWLSLAGTVARVSVLAVLMAVILIVARAPVARVGRAALAEPLRAFLVGFAAEVFFVPFLIAASIGLAITIIGIPFVALLVPIAIVLAVFAFLLGFTALACRVGEWVEDRLGWQPGNAFVATAIGSMILLGPTLLARFVDIATWSGGPITFLMVAIGLTVEFIAWTMGVGAAIITGLGRWYTVPPPIASTRRSAELPLRLRLLTELLTADSDCGLLLTEPGPHLDQRVGRRDDLVALLEAQHDAEPARVLVAMLDRITPLDLTLAGCVRLAVRFGG